MAVPRKRLLRSAACALMALAASTVAPAALAQSAAGGAVRAHASRAHPTTIHQSPRLWATVDICNTAAHSRVMGIRGSMPGSGQRDEQMFMRFRAQYLKAADGQWYYVASAADSGFLSVGRATYRARETGWNFQFMAPAAGTKFTLRGVVDFEWRRGKRVVRSARRSTTAGHRVLANGDPAGYSEARCEIA